MASYVYRIQVVLSPADAPLFPEEAYDLAKQTILFKCERKAKNFIQKALDSYKRTGDFDLWSPDQYTWCLDSKVTNARLTFLLEECKVRT